MAGVNDTGLSRSQDYNLGRGRVYLSGIDTTTGKPDASGFRDIGNVSEFNLNVETETLEHQTSREGLKTVDKEVTLSQKLGLSLTFDELNFQNLALFFAGEAGDGPTNPAVAGFGPVTLTTAVVLGRWYQIVDANGVRAYDIETANLTVTEQTPTTLTEGTDYTLDLAMGMIFVKADAVDIAAGDSLIVTLAADAGAKQADEVKALTQTSVAVALTFIAENPSDSDHETEYQFHQVTLRAEGDFALISDEWTSAQLTGTAEKNELADADSPYMTSRTIPS